MAKGANLNRNGGNGYKSAGNKRKKECGSNTRAARKAQKEKDKYVGKDPLPKKVTW